MTQAQKLAKAKFKQAIAYRQKTGVSLKEAFAHIYGKKTVTKKKIAKKVIRKKVAKKRIGKVDTKLKKQLKSQGKKMPHGYDVVKRTSRKRISGVKKKRITETNILNRIHKVKKDVDKLDEAQHKHMSKLGAVSSHIIHEVKEAHNKLIHWQKALMMLENTRKTLPATMKKYNMMDIKRVKEAIKEQKTHIAQLKKHIK
jgi:hypothetical protein